MRANGVPRRRVGRRPLPLPERGKGIRPIGPPPRVCRRPPPALRRNANWIDFSRNLEFVNHTHPLPGPRRRNLGPAAGSDSAPSKRRRLRRPYGRRNGT